MRGLEPPRGFEGWGVTWRDVEGSGLERRGVTADQPVRAGYAD
jgi:hypothetical protein